MHHLKDVYAEGVVFKNYKKQLFVKHVRDKFKENNGKAFGRKPKDKLPTQDDVLVYKYCTNRRIQKIIEKVRDEGEEISMSIMGRIIKATYQDIIEEEWLDILNSNWVLDLKNCRKLVAVRCKEVLNTYIINVARGILVDKE